MSYFSKSIIVPKNTPSDTPLQETIAVQTGIVHRVHVSIPSGHAGLTGVHVLQGLHQVAPTTGSEWFSGDDVELDYPEFVEIKESPFELTIEAYNRDDTYDHTFVVAIGVLPEWVLLPQTILKDLLQSISDILASIGTYLGMTKVT
jgi:hypothetical protein